ncbi:MAG: SH3 domain-containing protein, partial [Anaerolineae bacterium]|nr:SH3 domain-containing protein [Anaerolineae bacterium]
MKRLILLVSIAALLLISLPSGFTQQAVSVTAEAQNAVNLRAAPGIQAEQLGQMQIGVPYPVIGRSDLYPWVLLGDPSTNLPIGWAYLEIIVITGDLNTVPFVDTVVTAGATIQQSTPTATLPAGQPTSAATQPAATPTSTQAYTVAGTVLGEVNIRYGPGVDYPRVGVAQAGDRFQVTAWHTQLPWVQIRYEDSPTGTAWIAIDLLDIEGDIYTLPSISNTIFNLPTLTPTPSVIQSSSLLSDASIAISPEFAALGNRIWQQMLAFGFDPQTSQFGSLFLLDLQTGEAITFGDNIVYRGTSVNKINILAALYGVLNSPPNESVATDIANTMICSENAATNRLLSVVGNGDEWQGAQQVTNLMQTIGLRDSFLLAPYTVDPENPPIPPYAIPVPESDANNEIAHPEYYNRMTVDDTGWMLASIYQCAYEESGPLIEDFPAGTYDPRECRQMIHVMASNTV